MNRRFSLRLTVTAVLAVTGGLPAGVAAQPLYNVTDLGTLPEPPRSRWTVGTKINEAGTVLALAQWGTSNVRRTFVSSNGTQTEIGPFAGETNATTGVALNEAGEVAGYSPKCSPTCGGHAFLWSHGTMFDLGTLGLGQSVAWDLNRDGEVVGVAFGSDIGRAFLYSGGTTTDLGTLPGGSESLAYAINDSSQIVGGSSTTGPGGETLWHAVMWHDGSITDLHTGASTHSYATGMNAAGQAIGVHYFLDGGGGVAIRGFRYSAGTMTDLGSFDGGGSGANDINEAGDVVGWSNTATGDHAFLYTGDTLIDLGTLSGSNSSALAINSSRQVVGTAAGRTLAFLYMDGTMFDLNALIPPGSGWELREARDINDAGQIVGWGLIGGQARAFRLDPIPDTPFEREKSRAVVPQKQ